MKRSITATGIVLCILLGMVQTVPAQAEGPDSVDALLKEAPDLRKALEHDRILARAKALSAIPDAPQDKLAPLIAFTTQEKMLLEKLSPLKSLRKTTAKGLSTRLAELDLGPHEEVTLARFCFLRKIGERGLAALGRARDKDQEMRAETDRILAEFRGQGIPRGGYHRYRGEWLSLHERDRRRDLDDAVETLDAVRIEEHPLPFVPSKTKTNINKWEKTIGNRKGANFFRGAAQAIRDTLDADYELPRRLIASYSREPSRRRLLQKRNALTEPRKKALDLIKKYDKPQQPQVDQWRKTLEAQYGEYAALRKIDMGRFNRTSEATAWELVLTIEKKEKALEAINRWLERWERPAIGETPVNAAKNAPTTRRHLLPGRRQSGLEDSLWLVLRFRSGRILDVLARSEEILRNRKKLTDWEVAIVEDIQADAIDLYNERVATSLDASERQFVTVVNAYRRILGRPPLEIEERLTAAARKHSQEMKDLGYFGHISPVARNRGPGDRVRLEGYNAGGMAENCLGGRTNGRGAFEGWYHSPGHHRGMVFSGPHLGIGASQGHGMWTMVGGGTDLSWRMIHRDISPATRSAAEAALVEYVDALKAGKKVEEAQAVLRKHEPDVLPMLAHVAFQAVNAGRGDNARIFPHLLREIIDAGTPPGWRPLQIAAVSAAIDSLQLSRQLEARQLSLEIVKQHLDGVYGYTPRAKEAIRRDAAIDMRKNWEDEAQTRFRSAAAPVVAKKILPTERVGDGPSLEAPLKVLTRKDRLRLAKKFGGGSKTEKAVEMGLAWLAGVQDTDGAWRARSFPSLSKKFAGKNNLGAGNAEWEIGMTGLCLLAFVTAGNTPYQGEHAETVQRGANFLYQQIMDYGRFETTSSHYMYSHALATQALCEIYAYTKDPRIGVAAQLCTDYLMYGQDAVSGGWRYDPHQRGDTSVTGWCILAINGAYKARMDVAGFRAAERFLDSVTQPGYYKVGYMSPYDNGSRANRLGAVAVASRFLLGGNQKDPRLLLAAHRMKEDLPRTNGQDFYYWYYATLGMFQMGGQFWKAWNAALVPTLLRLQVSRGSSPFTGSWAPAGAHSGQGGRIYQTALGVLMLTTYYRYDRAQVPKVYTFTGDLETKSSPYMETLEATTDDQTRAITMRKMVDRFGTALGPVILRKLREKDVKNDLRRHLALMLMDCMDTNIEAAVLGLLSDEKNHTIASLLTRSLDRVASEASTPLMIKCLDHPSREVRSYASKVLGRVGDARAATALSQRLTKEKDGGTTKAINNAIRSLSHRDGVTLLVDDALGRGVKGKLRVLDSLQSLERNGIGTFLPKMKESEPKLYNTVKANVKEYMEASPIPVLITLLSSEHTDTRAESHKLLVAMSGRNYKYEPAGGEKQRKIQAGTWQAWWDEHLSEFKVED